MMGSLAIPSIGVNLPIYHGTSEEVLRLGVGHLEGTALPVGGKGTRSVLPAHSGIPGDTLFTHLDEVELGDEFTVHVLDHVLTYRVDHIETGLPPRTDRIR